VGPLTMAHIMPIADGGAAQAKANAGFF
jgi:hypothetical protein